LSGADIQNGVETEVAGLFDRFRNPLLHYLASFGLAYADGEELIQEAFLSLFQHLNRKKSSENLPGWLFRVAHNLALKRRYRVYREAQACGRAGTPNSVDLGPDPEQALMDVQTRERLLAVVSALPEQDRRCLYLRAEGLRYREIAGALDMSLGSVSMSLARSLARLARAAER
jgi:RNA polymerase sigma-70 factor, ECF subfamily